jgi:hypothetical protein
VSRLLGCLPAPVRHRGGGRGDKLVILNAGHRDADKASAAPATVTAGRFVVPRPNMDAAPALLLLLLAGELLHNLGLQITTTTLPSVTGSVLCRAGNRDILLCLNTAI